jgi:hypothetical protein
MPKAIFIDAKNQTIRPTQWEKAKAMGLAHLQALCQGYIEIARCPLSATLYVNEEAFLGRKPYGFKFNLSPEGPVYLGNGVLVGLPDAEGNDTDLDISTETLKQIIIFLKEAL